jgi:hypothetical protein
LIIVKRTFVFSHSLGRKRTLAAYCVYPIISQKNISQQKKNPGIAPRVPCAFALTEGRRECEAKVYFASFSISFATMLAGTSS